MYNTTWLYHNIIIPAINFAYDIERYGIKIDLDAREEVREELIKQTITTEEKIWDIAGEKFNINSSKQLGNTLYVKLGLPIREKTKEDNPSTSEKAIRDLYESDDAAHEILPYIIEFRNLRKLYSSYVEKLPTFLQADGRVHPEIFVSGTETGRWSIKNPPLQTIPKREDTKGAIKKRGLIVRKLFKACEGYLLIDIDLKQAELRILGYYSRDPELLKAARENIDIHSVIAAGIYDIPLQEFLEKKHTDKHIESLRTTTKRIGFGRVYLGTDEGLKKRIPELANIPLEDLKKDTEKYWKRFARVKEFQTETIEELIRSGKITSCWGRERHLYQATGAQNLSDYIIGSIIDGSFYNKIRDSLQRERYSNIRDAFKEGLNALIQGTSHDFLTLSLIKLNEELKNRKFPAYPWNEIHDAGLFEVREDKLDEFIQLAREIIEKPKDPVDVPMGIEVSYGKDWYEQEEYDFAA